MALTQGQKLHGFTVTRVRETAELGGSFVEMTHDKTGAELCWVDNGAENKLFCVGFKTLPEDSTGVFHILEHSVLCGSEKYPVREPFVELMKSSMNTFLNAMTFPDKTIYPISSRNEQDYMNLTEVYLDAVFAPRIFDNPGIFHQEGWHIELTDADAAPTYKGVVFNEMKGAMSSVDEVAFEGMLALVYPDNCYGHNSGGDPKHIPDLTYEQFLDSYKRFYHPSNSRIFLDGAVPLDRVLPLIDGYLSRYERSDEKHDITPQQPRSAEATTYYEIGAEEPEENRAQLILGKIVGSWADVDKLYAVQVLSDVLTGSNEAPLKRAILSAGLAQDMGMMMEDGIMQPVMALQFKNMDDSKADAIRQTVRETVKGLVESGLDRAAVEASINRLAFNLREPREPQGLIRAINSYGAWLYGGDPITYLLHDEVIAGLYARMDNGGYEKLLAELLLDETGLCVLHTLPSKTLGEELRKAEAARLQKIADGWSEADKAAVLKLNEELAAWQQTPDTPEQLATLPVLDLSEVSPDPMRTETEITAVDGVTVLQHKAPCHGIVHLNYYFNLTDCSLEKLSRLKLADKLLGALPTAHYDAAALQQAVKSDIGSLNVSLQAEAKVGDTQTCTPRLVVNCSVLEEKLPQAAALVHEILTQTKLDDPERIRELVLQRDQTLKQIGIEAGNMLASLQVKAHFSAIDAAAEAIGGHTHTRFVHELAAHFDEGIASFTALVKAKLTAAVCRARMTLSVTAAQPVDVTKIISAYPAGEPVAPSAAYVTNLPMNTGVRIPAQIGYAAMATHLSRLGMTYDGSAQVASTIVGLSYLWNVVRVQGGAYGVNGRVTRDGSVSVSSYRDPTPGRTLDAYRGMAAFLRSFVESGEALDKFIISTISGTEPLMSPRQVGQLADRYYFNGMTWDMLAAERREMLATTPEKLLYWCGLFDKLVEDAAICVVAHEEALEACKDEHLTVVDL
ncbi:MAG: insulinase family protein [Christensenellaceae bacterium]|nr:insulinase family protein [Christensenellaceae bacterium]